MKCRLLSRGMRSAALLLLMIAIPSLGRANPDEAGSPKDAKAILNKVVRAVASNRAQLKDVRAEILGRHREPSGRQAH